MAVSFRRAAAAACVLALGAAAHGGAEAPARVIEIVAADFKFAPATIEIAEGERVTLKVRSADGRKHGIAIRELGVKATLPKTGETVTLEVVGGTPGTYVMACSVFCGNGHTRMKGRLVVTPRAAQ